MTWIGALVAIRRHGHGPSVADKLAAAVPAELLDLRPFLADGPVGLGRYFADLGRWIDTRTKNSEQLLHPVLDALGFDVADCYRVMLGAAP